DLRLRVPSDVVLCDHDGKLEELLPEAWQSTHLLHPDYSKSFDSCSAEEWRRWVSSGRSRLHEFPPFVRVRTSVWGKHRIEPELQKRGFTGTPSYAYKPESFL